MVPRILQWECSWQNHQANPRGSHSIGGTTFAEHPQIQLASPTCCKYPIWTLRGHWGWHSEVSDKLDFLKYIFLFNLHYKNVKRAIKFLFLFFSRASICPFGFVRDEPAKLLPIIYLVSLHLLVWNAPASYITFFTHLWVFPQFLFHYAHQSTVQFQLFFSTELCADMREVQ